MRRRSIESALILGLVVGIGPLAIDMYLPALPAMSHDLGAGATELQLTLTACLAGLAVGQLVSGPLSDRLGRRPPLLVALGLFVLASLACAASPSTGVLVAARVAQGMAGGAATVIARAVVRDMHVGAAAARYFTGLMLVNGLAPILSPIIGAQLLRATSWRAIFVALAAFGLGIQLWSARSFEETVPPSRRVETHIQGTFAVMRALLTDRSFMPYALAGTLGFGAAFSYTAGSPFVLENVYGASPQLYSVLFAVNASGMIAASQLNRRLLRRFSPRVLLNVAAGVAALGGIGVLLACASGSRWLPTILVPAFALISSLGIVLPNATALALTAHGDAAGSASAVFGALQYVAAGVFAPLAGISGSKAALPMGLLCGTLGVTAFLVLVQRRGRPIEATDASGQSLQTT